MWGFSRTVYRGLRYLSPKSGHQITLRAKVWSKPPEHSLSMMDLTIAFFVLNIAMLVPSGWVLTNMENYKHRPGSK
uniref:Cytochrome c oxidase subunit 8B, mitochondrial-like protein n=1 Tax=Callorhinchus milii TaxID=7868 RepID=V9LII1_CALMI